MKSSRATVLAVLAAATLGIAGCSSSGGSDAFRALADQAAAFDSAARMSSAITYQTATVEPSDDTKTTGWWIPTTGAGQNVTTTTSGTNFEICAPGTVANASGYPQPDTCYLQQYSPAEAAATGWYVASGERGQRVATPNVLPLSDSLAGEATPGTGELPDGVTVTSDGDATTVTTADGVSRTYTITPTEATIKITVPATEMQPASVSTTTVTLVDTIPTTIDPDSITVDGAQGDYSQSMTDDEARDLTASILGTE